MDNAHTLVDLFSGCGGLAFGMKNAGFETVLANEIHFDPASTFIRNICPDDSDIMKIGPIQECLSDKRIMKWMKNNGIRKGTIDCIAGGPPCQGFSMAGKGDAQDPRNQLFTEYLRVVDRISPKTVVFENVPGFSNRYGLGLRKTLHNFLEDRGYVVSSGLLTSSDFGVPQLRKRFFAIGAKRNLMKSDSLKLPNPSYTDAMKKNELTTKNVIGDLDTYYLRGGYGSGEIHGEWEYHTWASGKFQRDMRRISGLGTRGTTWNTRIPNHTPKVAKRMGSLIQGKGLSDFQGSDLETSKHSQRALKENEVPNITIVSIPDDYIHYNPTLPRTLSVRECARLQTFPDHFHFLGKRTSGGLRRRTEVPQYTQVGNAVPPRLAKSIGIHLRNLIQM